MKIYTKTGDDGSTMLFGGGRVPKYHLRIEAYGTVDELNSFVGQIRDQEIEQTDKDILQTMQEKLFTIGSMLAANPEKKKVNVPQITQEDILFIEQAIDKMEEHLPALKSFVLPGGHPVASYCHLARCVCRRAERRTLELSVVEKGTVPPIILQYLNRLSDFLFVLSRKMVYYFKGTEIEWKS